MPGSPEATRPIVPGRGSRLFRLLFAGGKQARHLRRYRSPRPDAQVKNYTMRKWQL